MRLVESNGPGLNPRGPIYSVTDEGLLQTHVKGGAPENFTGANPSMRGMDAKQYQPGYTRLRIRWDYLSSEDQDLANALAEETGATPTATTKPVAPETVTPAPQVDELASQVMNYLASELGIPVHNREEMGEYLKGHAADSLQEARPQHNSQLVFAKGVRRPETVAGLSSAIMTQANTYFRLTSKLAEEGERTVKKVILYGNYSYLWSTDNGYEFFIEKSRAINTSNYDEISKDIATYGIDIRTDNIIRDIQKLGNRKEREHRFIKFAKQTGNELSNSANSPVNGRQRMGTADRAGTDGNSLANTESPGLATFITPSGEVYGFVTPDGEMYLDENIITSEHPIHEYTHIWDRVVAKNNPNLWKRGVELMRQTSLWKEIEEDANYGKKWKASSTLSPEDVEFRIASSSEL